MGNASKRFMRRYKTELRGALSQYERDVESFIPEADREACIRVLALGKKNERRVGADMRLFNYNFYTQFFHEAMNRMAYHAGLRCWK